MHTKIVAVIDTVHAYSLETLIPYFEKVDAIADYIIGLGNSNGSESANARTRTRDDLMDHTFMIEPNGGIGLEVIEPNTRFANSLWPHAKEFILPVALLTPLGALSFFDHASVTLNCQKHFTDTLISSLGLKPLKRGTEANRHWGMPIISITRDLAGNDLPEIQIATTSPLTDPVELKKLWDKINNG